MGEERRPSRRQPSSSRHSSTSRFKPRSRTSNQSLQSAGRPQETTFTSFEPFSPPKDSNGTHGEGEDKAEDKAEDKRMSRMSRMSDTISIHSYSSSKRSRSIYAPHHENSVVIEPRSEPAHSQYGDLTDGNLSSGVSQASRSLHAVLMDQPEQSRPALFPDNLNTYRSNPQALIDLTTRQLSTFIHREGGPERVIKTLAKDLSEKDAEISMLRKKNDKYAFLFKDHLTTVHQMSRLEADKKVQSHFPDTNENVRTYSEEVRQALFDASEDLFAAHDAVLTSTTAGAVRQPPAPPLARNKSTKQTQHPELPAITPSPQRRRQTVAKGNTIPINPMNTKRTGFWGVFGGSTRAVKESANNRASIANILGMPLASPKAQSLRSPSIAESPMKAPPLEMEQKIDEGDLPPPLLTMSQLIHLFPTPTYDNYGFVIDEPRIHSYIQYWTAKNKLPVESYKRILAPSKAPKSRPTSMISLGDDDVNLSDSLEVLIPEPDTAADSTDVPSKSWYDYLAFGGSLGLLSRMPTQPQGSESINHVTSNDADSEDDEDPAEIEARRCEAIVDPDDYQELALTLRDEITKEYNTLQTDRNRAWSRLLNTMAADNAATSNRLSRLLLSTNTEGVRERSNTFSSSSVGIANLASSQYQEQFIKFVLGGIPMNLRSKIWLENAESSIHYSPEAFDIYKREFDANTKKLKPIIHDINADKTRTLTNNIWFRGELAEYKSRDPEQHQKQLSSQLHLESILRAFAVRNPHIGYIQGFNLIAGYLMLAVPTTEQAFWVFTFLIETVLPETYFSVGDTAFRGPRADTIVLRTYIRQLMPKLAAHMDDLDLPDEQTVPINWLLTAFASTLSVEALFRVWDVVLSIPAQGTYLLRVALALLKINEEKLLKTQSASALYAVLDRHMGAGVSIDGLVHASWVLGRMVTPAAVTKRREAAFAQL